MNSPNFAFTEFSEVRLALRTVASCLRWKKLASREACREEGGASMDFNEKVLYQQIHPAKLAADVGGSLLSTYLMWRRRFAWAMLAAFVPAVLASVLVKGTRTWSRESTPHLGGTCSATWTGASWTRGASLGKC